ncbi:uncharacterized protein NPIL_389481, partial [Nephila pilipes]
VPYNSATYRSTPEEITQIGKPDLVLAPIERHIDHRQTDDFKERKSQVPKLPQITSKSETQFSVPKIHSNRHHRELIFTKKVLSRMERESKKTEMMPQPNVVEKQPSSTPSRESQVSSSKEVIIDPSRDLKSFAPMRLMQDPLR